MALPLKLPFFMGLSVKLMSFSPFFGSVFGNPTIMGWQKRGRKVVIIECNWSVKKRVLYVQPD